MHKVNYLLCACSHRAFRDVNGTPPGKDVLKLHLQELLKTDLSALSQVTIIQTLPLNRGLYADEYWNIENEITELSKYCKVEKLPVQDSWWSYSAWIHAIRHYHIAFDYSILIEDDFYPAHKDFVNLLIDKHQRALPNGGYLGSFYYLNHMALSNGIVDTKSALIGFDKYADPIGELAQGAQVIFGQAFFENKMADYTDEYRTLRWANNIHELAHKGTYGKTSIDLINPIQYLFDKEIADVALHLE